MELTKHNIQKGLVVILIIFIISLLLSLKANPDASIFFSLKRVQEKAFLKLKSSPTDRVNYMSSLLDDRLSELQNTFNSKSYGYILPSSLRYFTLAGQITDLVVANHLTDEVEPLKNQFLNHRKALDTLYVAYPKNTDNVEYKYIQDDFNYLGLYLDKLEKVK